MHQPLWEMGSVPWASAVSLRCSCNCCFAGGNEAAAGRFGANAPASLALADNVHPGDNHEGWARLGKGHLGRREKLRQTFNAPARDFQNSATARHERVSPLPNCVRNGEARLRRAFVPPLRGSALLHAFTQGSRPGLLFRPLRGLRAGGYDENRFAGNTPWHESV